VVVKRKSRLCVLQGTLQGGFFGSALGGSSHLGQLYLDMHLRSAYTYVFEPGYNSDAGRLWTFFVPALLPCNQEAYCPAGSD